MEKAANRQADTVYKTAVSELAVKPRYGEAVVPPPWEAMVYFDAPAHNHTMVRRGRAVMISAQWAIGPAHAFADLGDSAGVPGYVRPADITTWWLRAGSNGLHSGGELRRIEKVVNHPDFSPPRFSVVANGLRAEAVFHPVNDLTLIKLAEPINLPTVPISDGAPKPGDRVTMFGGRDGAAEGLLQLDTTIIPSTAGASTADNELCAANTVLPDVAGRGFSGGPVVTYDGDEEPVLVGIVSRAGLLYVKCDYGPSVIITDLTKHADWIQHNLDA
jgi:hypothetical protein